MNALPHVMTSKRPLPVTLVNTAARALTSVGKHREPLDAKRLMQAARLRTGLSDFGQPDVLEPLERLVDAIENEAALHAVGHMITRGRLLSSLTTRLRVQALLQDHPEIHDLPIEAPIVIAGLQRTGTTMLHRLLASDPALRSLAGWEALSPIAPKPLRPGARDPRRLQAKLSERGLAYLAPSFFAIHPVEADAPEEDVLLLDYSFMSTVPEATLRVPSYARWLEHADHRPAYRYLRTLLQVLSWQQGRGKRWLLKTPHHLEYLDVLRGEFPDATIVQTHRDPARTLASFCSMVAHGRAVFSDDVSLLEVGHDWARKVARMLERSLHYRQKVNDAGFIDLSYYELIADPLPSVRRVYEAVGLPWSAGSEARLTRTRRNNPQHKYGTHRYRLQDFGLHPEGLDPVFGLYRKRFHIAREGHTQWAHA